MNDFTLEQKRKFVLRHVIQLARWQCPGVTHECRNMVEESPLDWLNKTFNQFAELYEHDKDTIDRLIEEKP